MCEPVSPLIDQIKDLKHQPRSKDQHRSTERAAQIVGRVNDKFPGAITIGAELAAELPAMPRTKTGKDHEYLQYVAKQRERIVDGSRHAWADTLHGNERVDDCALGDAVDRIAFVCIDLRIYPSARKLMEYLRGQYGNKDVHLNSTHPLWCACKPRRVEQWFK